MERLPTDGIRFPRPLQPGDTIGVTSPSSGVPDKMRRRLEFAVESLRERGYDVVVGECMRADGPVSAPKEKRAAELQRMLTDPAIAAVVPPWGGELAIDLLDQLDWAALADTEPSWLVGYSDSTTYMLPFTVHLGWATLHGANLLDSPYRLPDGLLHWVDVATATEPFTQRGVGRFKTGAFDDWETEPEITDLGLDGLGSWSTLEPGPVDVTGRLIGGCIEVMAPIAGSPYADMRAFGSSAEEGLVVYLEACEDAAYTIGRMLHGLRLAGWFEHANAVLIGRTSAPGSPYYTQRDAVADALGGLGVPVVLDVECGHVSPRMPMVNGAVARVVLDGDRQEVTQTLS